MKRDQIKAMIYGHAIGDALGVPVEFQTREQLLRNPVKEMQSGGTYNMPAGSWSDDTSMTLCVLDSLAEKGKVDFEDIMQHFMRWLDSEYTPTGKVFDVGHGTMKSLMRYKKGALPLESGGRSERDNGNGSLMRISPISLYLALTKEKMDDEAVELVHKVSSLTHAHPRSLIACGIYTFIAFGLLKGKGVSDAVTEGIDGAYEYYSEHSDFMLEKEMYDRVWNLRRLKALQDADIRSSGYVIDTLEAALWCFITTKSYRACVLKAVNLGEDTDTVAAIAGGLAGLAYGWYDIQEDWKKDLLRTDFIDGLCDKFSDRFHIVN